MHYITFLFQRESKKRTKGNEGKHEDRNREQKTKGQTVGRTFDRKRDGNALHARESMKLRSARSRHIRLLGLRTRISVVSLRSVVFPLRVQRKFRDKSNIARPQLCLSRKQDFRRNDFEII